MTQIKKISNPEHIIKNFSNPKQDQKVLILEISLWDLSIGLGVSVSQSVSVVGESSKPTMESTETSAMPEATTVGTSPISNFDQYSKLLTPIPLRVLGHPVVGKALAACSNSDAVVLGSVKVGFSLGSVSNIEVTNGRGYRDLGPPVLWWVARRQRRLRLRVWQWCRRSLVSIHGWFIILFLLSQTWVMGLLMSLWKGKIMLKYRRATTMLIRWVWSTKEPLPVLYLF